MKLFKQIFFDASLLRFLVVGTINTLIALALMLSLYNLFGFGYWPSTSITYITGMALSFLLNKYWTFRSKNNTAKAILSFIPLNIFTYIVSYGIAERLISVMFIGWGQKVSDHIAIFVGMCLFTTLNYLGQRFVVFRTGHSPENKGK